MVEVNNQKLKEFFAVFYDEYSDAIFRYCRFQTSNREKALDITQDTFIKTWEYLSSGKKVENIRAFLYKVARNLIIDYRRKKKSYSLEEMMNEGFDLKSEEGGLATHESIFEGNIAIETLERLDEKYREVLMLRYVEDMSVKDIAKIMGRTENNISVRIHRGLEKLKILLEENK